MTGADDRVPVLEAQVQDLLKRLRNAELRHERDIYIIGDALIAAAEANNLCSEYDDVIDSINKDLKVKLPGREREWIVTVTGSIPFTRETTVYATSLEDAREVVRGDLQEKPKLDLDDLEVEMTGMTFDDVSSFEIEEA